MNDGCECEAFKCVLVTYLGKCLCIIRSKFFMNLSYLHSSIVYCYSSQWCFMAQYFGQRFSDWRRPDWDHSFRVSQAYSGIIRVLCHNWCPAETVVVMSDYFTNWYVKPWHETKFVLEKRESFQQNIII